MASVLQLRGGDTATVNAITPVSREVLVDTTTNRLRVGDGSTAGGNVIALLADVSAHPGITNLSGSGTASVYTIASDTGTNATIPAATNAAAGVATAAQITELEALRTNVGNSATNTNLGTFTGVTIQDNRTVKQALQDLETEVEDRLPDFVQWRVGTGPGYYFSGVNLIETTLQMQPTKYFSASADVLLRTPSTLNYILSDLGNGSSVHVSPIRINNNKVTLRIFDGTTSNHTTWETASILQANTRYNIVTVYNDGAVSIFVNGEKYNVTEVVVGAGGTDGITTTTGNIEIGNDISSANNLQGEIYSAFVFNRAVTDAEAVLLSRGQRLGFADRGATGAASYTSDFSAGVDGWAANTGTIAGNIDAIGGEDDTLRYTATADPATYFRKTGLFSVGKRYRVSVDIFIPSSNIDIDGVRITIGGSSPVEIYNNTPTADSWVTVSNEVINTSTGLTDNLIVNLKSGATLSPPHAAGTDVIYIKNVVVTPIGEVLSLLPSGAAPTVWADQSGNGYNGSVTSATLINPMPLHANAFVSLTNLPTSSAGLATGRVWSDGGTLKVV